MLKPRRRKDGPRFDLLFLGDTCFGEPYQEYRGNTGRENILQTRGYAYSLSELKPILARADFTIANLETPVTDLEVSPFVGKQRYIHKADVLLTPQTLQSCGIGAVSLANNHALDYGSRGLAQTLDALKAHQCIAFGAAHSNGDEAVPLVFELRSGTSRLRIAVFAGQDGSIAAHEPADGARLRLLDPARIGEQVSALKATNPELLAIAFPHWGSNYRWRTSRQRVLADRLVAAGIDLILGHGAHMLQEVETRAGQWVVFSLGNFVFNTPGRYAMYAAPPFSLLARLIARPGAERWSIAVRLYPIVSENKRTDWRPRLVSEAEFETVRYLLAAKSQGPRLDAGRDRTGYYLQLAVRAGG